MSALRFRRLGEWEWPPQQGGAAIMACLCCLCVIGAVGGPAPVLCVSCIGKMRAGEVALAMASHARTRRILRERAINAAQMAAGLEEGSSAHERATAVADALLELAQELCP